jgi:hypothetical protein
MQQSQLRCVFVTVPPLLAAILVEALSRRVELHLLAESDAREGIAERLEGLTPDLLVVGLTPGEPDALGASLIQLIPRGKVLLISNSGDQAFVYEMRSCRSVLSNFSPDTLLTIVLGPNSTSPSEHSLPKI